MSAEHSVEYSLECLHKLCIIPALSTIQGHASMLEDRMKQPPVQRLISSWRPDDDFVLAGVANLTMDNANGRFMQDAASALPINLSVTAETVHPTASVLLPRLPFEPRNDSGILRLLNWIGQAALMYSFRFTDDTLKRKTHGTIVVLIKSCLNVFLLFSWMGCVCCLSVTML